MIEWLFVEAQTDYALTFGLALASHSHCSLQSNHQLFLFSTATAGLQYTCWLDNRTWSYYCATVASLYSRLIVTVLASSSGKPTFITCLYNFKLSLTFYKDYYGQCKSKYMWFLKMYIDYVKGCYIMVQFKRKWQMFMVKLFIKEDCGFLIKYYSVSKKNIPLNRPLSYISSWVYGW